MNTFSKVNLQNKVVMVNEFDQIGEAEFMYGGNWLDYHLSDSTGDLGKIYDPTLNIFKEPMPVDIVGVACSSWTLNTNTGIYSSPVPNPGVTTTQDDAGTFYYWNESNYQADNNTGWGLTTK